MERTFEDKKSKIGTLLVSLLICCRLFNYILPSVYSGNIQVGIISMGLIWVIYVIYIFLFHVTKTELYSTAFITLVLVYFVASNFLYSGHVRLLTTHFIEYGLLGYLIAGCEIDSEKACRNVCYIQLITFPLIFSTIQSGYSIYERSIGMGASYAMLPPAVTSLVHFLYYRKKRTYLLYASYIIGIYLIWSIISNGTRGAILCVFVLILLVLLNSNKIRGRISLSRTVIIISVLVLAFNFSSILQFLDPLLQKAGIRLSFVEKTLALNRITGDISNGRFDIYRLAVDDFIKSPIIGNGIGCYPELHNTSIDYPHNIVLQVLSEGGLVLGVPLIGVLFWCLYCLISGTIQNKNLRIMSIMLASCTIPVVFVSDELWNFPLLWLLFGLLIKKRRLLVAES